MSTEQMIRDVLERMVSEAPEPPTPEGFDMPVVRPAEPPRRWRQLAVAASVVVVALIGVLAVQSTRVPEPVTESATVEELRVALAAGLAALAESPGVEGTTRSTIGGFPSRRIWFAWTPQNVAVVQQTDIDVTDTAWWLSSSEPPRVGERFAVDAWVDRDDVFLRATSRLGEQSPWTESERPGGPLAWAVGLLDDETRPMFLELVVFEPAEVTRRLTAEGSVWTMVGADESSGATSEFVFDAEGRLRRLTGDILIPEFELDEIPASGRVIEFFPLTEAPMIPVPKEGAALDISIFEVPQNFFESP